MKRFLVFWGQNYYSGGGGMHDFNNDFDDLETARAEAIEWTSDAYWSHVWDNEQRAIVWDSEKDAP